MESQEEIWKDIEGHEGSYQVSNLGQVKSLKYGKERILTPFIDQGYNKVTLSNGKEKSVRCHRLEAIAFIPNPENKRTINHKNGIKNDNRLENLEWATDSENHRHAFRELGRKPSGTSPVTQYTKAGKLIQTFDSQQDAKRMTNINNISAVCRGKQDTAGGFVWKYSENQ